MFTSPAQKEIWIESVEAAPRKKETYRTTSQRKAYDRLVAITKIRPETYYANLCPRARAILITGPAGAGKIAIVRAYSRLNRLPMFSFLAASWTPMGAIQPPSLLAIRDFVRAHDKGVVYVDEVDKLCPAGHEVQQSSWALSCLGEFISWIDADARLVGLGWSECDVRRFRRGYRIIASGAWQHCDAKARAASKRGSLGFGLDPRPRSYGEILRDDDAIPEEVRFRFFSETVQVDLPTRGDFREGIEQIHDELEYHVEIPEELLTEAVDSRLGVRWLESYLAKLLLLLDVEKAERDDNDELAQAPIIRHLTRIEYDHLYKRMADWVISLRQALTRYETTLVLAMDRPASSQAVCDLIANGWEEHPALLQAVRELLEGLVPLEAAQLDSNRAYLLLQGLSFATKFALQKHTPGLQRAGLLVQTVTVRELTDRLETVLRSLDGASIG